MFVSCDFVTPDITGMDSVTWNAHLSLSTCQQPKSHCRNKYVLQQVGLFPGYLLAGLGWGIFFLICFVYFFFYQLQLRQKRVGGGFCSSGDNRRLCLCSHGDKIQGAFWLPSNLLPTPGSQVKVGQRERGAFVSQVLQLLLLIKRRALVPSHLPSLRRV